MSFIPIYSPHHPSAATITYTDNKVSSSAATAVRSFSSCAIGTASDDRVIIVGAGTSGGGGSGDSIASITVGGTALANQFSRVHTDHNQAHLWAGTVTSGTSATIVLTWNRAANASGIAVWATTGLDISSGVTDSGSAVITNSTSAMSADLDISAGGIAIGYSVNTAAEDVNPTFVFSGGFSSTNFNSAMDYARAQGGTSAAFAAAQSGLTLTSTPQAQCGYATTVFASWPPA